MARKKVDKTASKAPEKESSKVPSITMLGSIPKIDKAKTDTPAPPEEVIKPATHSIASTANKTDKTSKRKTKKSSPGRSQPKRGDPAQDSPSNLKDDHLDDEIKEVDTPESNQNNLFGFFDEAAEKGEIQEERISEPFSMTTKRSKVAGHKVHASRLKKADSFSENHDVKVHSEDDALKDDRFHSSEDESYRDASAESHDGFDNEVEIPKENVMSPRTKLRTFDAASLQTMVSIPYDTSGSNRRLNWEIASALGGRLSVGDKYTLLSLDIYSGETLLKTDQKTFRSLQENIAFQTFHDLEHLYNFLRNGWVVPKNKHPSVDKNARQMIYQQSNLVRNHPQAQKRFLKLTTMRDEYTPFGRQIAHSTASTSTTPSTPTQIIVQDSNVNPFEKFDGEPEKWKEWKKDVISVAGQSYIGQYLTIAPLDAAERKDDKRLFHALQNALQAGNAEYLLHEQRLSVEGPSGFYLWKRLTKAFDTKVNKTTEITDLLNVLKNLVLDEGTSVNEINNKFLSTKQKLVNLGVTKSPIEWGTELYQCITQDKEDTYFNLHQFIATSLNDVDTCTVHERTDKRLLYIMKAYQTMLENSGQDKGSSTSSSARRTQMRNNSKKTRRRYSSSSGADTDQEDEKINQSFFNIDQALLSKLSRNERNKILRMRNLAQNAYYTHDHTDDSRRSKNKRGRESRHKNRTSNTSKGKKAKKAYRVSKHDTDDDASPSPPPENHVKVLMRDPSERKDDEIDEVSNSNRQSTSTLAGDKKKKKQQNKKKKKSTGKNNPDTETTNGKYSSSVSSQSSNRTFLLSRRTEDSTKDRIIMDSGTELTLVGGTGWVPVYLSKTKTTMVGTALAKLGLTDLPLGDFLAKVTCSNGKQILIGLGGAAYNNDPNQTETLVNPNKLRAYGSEVDDRPECFGGKQRLYVEDCMISLDYDRASNIISLDLSKPSSKELDELPVLWLTPQISPKDKRDHGVAFGRKVSQKSTVHLELEVPPDDVFPNTSKPASHSSTAISTSLDPQDHAEFDKTVGPIAEADMNNGEISNSKKRKKAQKRVTFDVPTDSDDNMDTSKRYKSVDDKTKANWTKCLGNPPANVLDKTLAATTQMATAPLSTERRSVPRKHYKRRAAALHPKRVKGTCYSDTFFSTIQSIRGFTCVQLFVYSLADYIFVKPLKKEKFSHSALLESITQVGAPQQMYTDNSKTQKGNKWEVTLANLFVWHKFCAPHKQNQNKAERKIQDVKNRVIDTLYKAQAPLVFWCYCMMFIVDCLNHTAKKKLDWRTPKEVMTGNTPDISMFRFGFWDEIEYFEPTSKFPHYKWLPGRFVGIAWDHGDNFTYKVWTTPDGDYNKGKLLIRDVVRNKGASDNEAVLTDEQRIQYADFNLESNTIKDMKSNNIRISKRKRKRIIQDLLDPNSDTEDIDPEEQQLRKQLQAPILTTPNPSTSIEWEHGVDVNDIPQPIAESDEGVALMDDVDPNDKASTIEDSEAVNNALSPTLQPDDIGGATVERIVGHSYKEAQLILKVDWTYGPTTEETILDMKIDHPKKTAEYVMDNEASISRGRKRCTHVSWAKKTLRDYKRSIRRLLRIYEFSLGENHHDIRLIRRTIANAGPNKKKKKRFDPGPRFHYGVQVPRTVEQALALDKANGNNLWKEAIDKEMTALRDLKCFEFRDKGDIPGDEYQKTRLMMIFDVKNDLRRKARLVAQGQLVDILDHVVYSSCVKAISVRLLCVIAHKNKLDIKCGDIGNAFVNAYTAEKIYCIAGLEFGEDSIGKTIIIKKALYGLASSAERWHSMLAATLRAEGWKPTRYDRDVWIRLHEPTNTYEYICTYVDDFMVFSRDTKSIMDFFHKHFCIKGDGPPDYYLGNDYKKDPHGRWTVGCKKYIKDVLIKVQETHGTLRKRNNPCEQDVHLETDASPLLNAIEHRQYQQLIGILNWIMQIGRIDIAYATISLARFVAAPRRTHLLHALHIFAYLKSYPNVRTVVDSSDPIYEYGEEHLNANIQKKMEKFYPEASEEIDRRLPTPLYPELQTTVFVDSDHAHDKVTRRSVTGIIIFVGRTPVQAISKRQSSIETSTYGAEFNAMRTASEEVIAIRYMLRCLGVTVDKPTPVIGDNAAVIINASYPESLLKKKHVAISYHKTRECVAAGIVQPLKTKTTFNFADALTKALPTRLFKDLMKGFMTGIS